MFTGIIEQLGNITKLEKENTNVHLTVKADFTNELKIDQSVAHNGICLTVVKIDNDKKEYVVTAIKETLDRSNLGDFEVGTLVNLKRCTAIGHRLDGHIVQGHVDQTGICTEIKNENGSWVYRIEYEPNGHITVEKGSICINGVSLTVCDSTPNSFTVSIIPYTQEETNFKTLKIGSKVNLEFDIVGKYVSKLFELQTN